MKTCALGLGLAAAVAGAAHAEYDMVAFEDAYTVTAADFGGASVTVEVRDIYMVSADAADVLLNVYNWNSSGAPTAGFFQSFTGTGWLPNNLGAPFDTEALQKADSFVTIGGFGADALQLPGAGAGTGVDPNFGGNGAAAPGANAGWFNSSPPSLNGQVMMYDNGVMGTLIARFTSTESFTMAGTEFEATFNQGLGTDGQQGSYVVAPAPGAVALLGLAGVIGRRRRG